MQNTTCQNEKIIYFSRVKTVEENEKKGHRRMNRRYLEVSVGANVGVLSTLRRGLSQLAPSDEPTVHFLHASDEWKKQSSRR
jgi:hypothetical protein